MQVEILTDHGKWKRGEKPHLRQTTGLYLVDAGVAREIKTEASMEQLVAAGSTVVETVLTPTWGLRKLQDDSYQIVWQFMTETRWFRQPPPDCPAELANQFRALKPRLRETTEVTINRAAVRDRSALARR